MRNPLAFLLAAATLTACAHKSPPATTAVAQQAMAEYQTAIRSVVKDSSRADSLIALTTEFQKTVNEGAARDSVALVAIAALNADFGATRADYSAAVTRTSAERHETISKLIAMRARMAALVTADEWEQLKKVRLKVMNAELNAMAI